jgi:hypothetical protein
MGTRKSLLASQSVQILLRTHRFGDGQISHGCLQIVFATLRHVTHCDNEKAWKGMTACQDISSIYHIDSLHCPLANTPLNLATKSFGEGSVIFGLL